MFVTSYLFVVDTDPTNPNHHSLHTTTAPHLLTRRPSSGDRIVATIDLRTERRHEDGRAVWCEAFMRGRLATHAGRSALPGEDTLDAAAGDALSLYVPELLDGAAWVYAPCEYVAGDMPTRRRWSQSPADCWQEER